MSPDTQLALLCIIVLLLASYIFFFYKGGPVSGEVNAERQRIGLNLEKMRRLYTENNHLQRSSIIEQISGYGGHPQTTQKVTANVNQIGRNMTTLYGAEAGSALTDLLHERHGYVQTMAQLAHQNKDISGEYEKLQANTKKLVDFFVSVNPRVDPKTIETLLTTQADKFYKKILHTAKHECIASMSEFEALCKCTGEFLDTFDDATWKHLTGSTHKYQ